MSKIKLQKAKLKPNNGEPKRQPNSYNTRNIPGIVPHLYNFKDLLIQCVEHGMSKGYDIEAHTHLQDVLNIVYNEALTGNMLACALYLKTMSEAASKLESRNIEHTNPNYSLVFQSATTLPNESE